MRNINIDEFEQMPLHVHRFLADVPLHSLSRVALLGGREGMTLPGIKAVIGFDSGGEVEVGPVSKALFWLRGLVGRILRWDEAPELVDSVSYLPRLSAEDRARSLVPPGKVEGISRILYCFEHELLAEIINRTVHCFWLMASERTADGYALYMAVYVKKLNWFTPIYMALVSPLLKWIIYPSMEKGIKRRWEQVFPRGTRLTPVLPHGV